MARNSSGKITRPEMRDALLRSGYLLEGRVETMLRDRWLYVETNATYEDPESGKSREYDIYAMSDCNAGTSESDSIFPVILAECVNNPQPFVVLTKDPLLPEMHHEGIVMSGLPVKVRSDDDGWQRLSKFLSFEEFSHHCKGRIGTQYCSFIKKKSGHSEEWMALHEGAHYESLKKLCNIVDFRVRQTFRSWTFDSRPERVCVEIYYPVLIVQGDLLEARQTKRSVTLRSSDHVQFRRSFVSNGNERDYFIDIIRERYLPRYVDMIEGEIRRAASRMKRHHKEIRTSMDLIVELAKAGTTPEEVHEAMEYRD